MHIIGNAEKAREEQFVASGVLSTGDAVVVNSDGTVSVIGSSGSNLSPSPISSSVATFNAGGTTQNIKVSSDPNNSGKFVVIYKDLANSGYGTAVVGTVSGASISFGSEVVFRSGEIAGCDLSFDPNTSNKFVVTYQANDAPYYCSVKVGTISGTTISFGSEYTVSDSNLPLVAFDPSSANKFVFAYSDASYVGKALIGTVSGTSISFGSASTYESSAVYQNTIAADPNNAGKFIVAYQDSNNSSYGTAVVGTISGTSISFGTSSVFNSGNTASFSSAFDPNNSGKLAISYRNYANSQYGTAVIGTVSGSSVTFGSPVVFNAGQTEVTSVSFDENNNNVFAVGYEDIADSYYGKAVFGTISGTSVSFSNEVAFNEARTDFLSIAFDPNQTSSLFIAYRDGADSSKGKAILATATNLTSENYIGTAATGAPDGKAAKINIKGAVADIPTSGFGIDNASYDNVSFSVNSQTTSPYGMVFNTDGTKMYVTSAGFGVYQYSLSTGFDLSTVSYDNVSFDATSQNDGISGVAFNSDGTKMYILGYNSPSDQVYQYSLSTGFDISTASYDSVSFSVSQESLPFSIAFNNDGTKMFVSGFSSDTVYQYSLSTGFDLSTTSYDNVSFSAQSEESSLYGLAFNNDGTKMFVCGDSSGSVFQYDLSTGFDLSTASYNGVSFDLSSQDTTPREIFFNNDGTKMYVAGDQNDTIFQYSSVSVLTAGQSYYVQTDGTLGTTPADPSVFAGTAVAATKLIVKG